jgi:hypothetical protein
MSVLGKVPRFKPKRSKDMAAVIQLPQPSFWAKRKKQPPPVSQTTPAAAVNT